MTTDAALLEAKKIHGTVTIESLGKGKNKSIVEYDGSVRKLLCAVGGFSLIGCIQMAYEIYGEDFFNSVGYYNYPEKDRYIELLESPLVVEFYGGE